MRQIIGIIMGDNLLKIYEGNVNDFSESFLKLTHFHRKIAFYKFSGFELLVSKVICLQQLHYFIQDLSLSAQKLSVINYKFE